MLHHTGLHGVLYAFSLNSYMYVFISDLSDYFSALFETSWAPLCTCDMLAVI